MNYLAHLCFAQNNAYSLVGNLMGDFLKGVTISQCHPLIQRGIRSHLFIDKFTDTNPLVKELKRNFSKDQRRFSGIILDIAFDYFLLKHWNQFYSIDKHRCILHFNEKLLQARDLMPPLMANSVTRIVKHNVLDSYNNLSGIETALSRVSNRIRYSNTLHLGMVDVNQHYKEIERTFLHLYDVLLKRLNAPAYLTIGK